MDIRIIEDKYIASVREDKYTAKVRELVVKDGVEYYGYDDKFYGYDDECYGYFTGEREYV
jgi:hypothetical protein